MLPEARISVREKDDEMLMDRIKLQAWEDFQAHLIVFEKDEIVISNFHLELLRLFAGMTT